MPAYSMTSIRRGSSGPDTTAESRSWLPSLTEIRLPRGSKSSACPPAKGGCRSRRVPLPLASVVRRARSRSSASRRYSVSGSRSRTRSRNIERWPFIWSRIQPLARDSIAEGSSGARTRASSPQANWEKPAAASAQTARTKVVHREDRGIALLPRTDSRPLPDRDRPGLSEPVSCSRRPDRRAFLAAQALRMDCLKRE